VNEEPTQGGEPARQSRPIADHGEIVATISRRLVHLLKEYYGKGPTRAKTHYFGDVVLVLLRGGFTKVEETLLQEGYGDAVIEQRMRFQDAMRPRFNEVIEDATGREVVAFMSGSHQDPDILSELFILAPSQPGEELFSDAEAGDGE
jgi:uncharacterized protein YbcI